MYVYTNTQYNTYLFTSMYNVLKYITCIHVYKTGGISSQRKKTEATRQKTEAEGT